MHKPFLGKWISILYRIEQNFFDKQYKAYGLDGGRYAYLLCLFRQEGITQEAISKYVNVDKATTARAINKLEAMGYVYRVAEPADKRAYRVFLTEKARLLEPAMRKVLQEWAELITTDLSLTEKETVYTLMQQMAERAVVVKEQQLGIPMISKGES